MVDHDHLGALPDVEQRAPMVSFASSGDCVVNDQSSSGVVTPDGRPQPPLDPLPLYMQNPDVGANARREENEGREGEAAYAQLEAARAPPVEEPVPVFRDDACVVVEQRRGPDGQAGGRPPREDEDPRLLRGAAARPGGGFAASWTNKHGSRTPSPPKPRRVVGGGGGRESLEIADVPQKTVCVAKESRGCGIEEVFEQNM